MKNIVKNVWQNKFQRYLTIILIIIGLALLTSQALLQDSSVLEVSHDKVSETLDVPFIGEINTTEYSLPALAIMLGLIDGFNPCAMWVLVYLISIILLMNNKRKVWLLVGSFVLASGILYFLFMTAWLNAFLLMGYFRPVTLLIGLFAAGFGINNIYDFIKNKGEIVCKVGDAGSKEKVMSRIDHIAKSPLTWATVFSIVVLAFIINSIEFACSSAVPAIFTQVLALADISTISHYGYILLYTLFFMLDDLIIFGMAAFTVNSSACTKYAKYCKIIGGVVLTALGIILVFAPNILQ